MKKITVKLTFVEPLLGSQPSNPNIYLDYVASKAPEDERIKIEDEVAALYLEAGWITEPVDKAALGAMLKGSFAVSAAFLYPISSL